MFQLVGISCLVGCIASYQVYWTAMADEIAAARQWHAQLLPLPGFAMHFEVHGFSSIHAFRSLFCRYRSFSAYMFWND